jgi:chromosome segregation ATPase
MDQLFAILITNCKKCSVQKRSLKATPLRTTTHHRKPVTERSSRSLPLSPHPSQRPDDPDDERAHELKALHLQEENSKQILQLKARVLELEGSLNETENVLKEAESRLEDEINNFYDRIQDLQKKHELLMNESELKLHNVQVRLEDSDEIRRISKEECGRLQKQAKDARESLRLSEATVTACVKKLKDFASAAQSTEESLKTRIRILERKLGEKQKDTYRKVSQGFRQGDRVRVVGCKKYPEMNGTEGQIKFRFYAIQYVHGVATVSERNLLKVN